jgi:hypothetical protein
MGFDRDERPGVHRQVATDCTSTSSRTSEALQYELLDVPAASDRHTTNTVNAGLDLAEGLFGRAMAMRLSASGVSAAKRSCGGELAPIERWAAAGS